MVTWIDEDGRQRSSSFQTETKRDALAKSLLERRLTVYVADQMQLALPNETATSATYDPRYEIPF